MSDEIQQTTITDEHLKQFADAIGLSTVAPGRVSVILLFELFGRTLSNTLDTLPAKIIAEMRALEGLGPPQGTARQEAFSKHGILKGLYKKHYLLGGWNSVPKNLSLELTNNPERLHEIVRSHWHPGNADVDNAEIAQRIADDVTGLYLERKDRRKLTGEWIVYAKHEGKNYYLTLGRHDEGDEHIKQRIEAYCTTEFEWLADVLK